MKVNGLDMVLDNSPVSRQIKKRGIYEATETVLMRKHLKPGGVFVDAGAHIGYHTMLAASIVGLDAGKVYSFEPAVENYKILSKNITMNRLRNVCSFHLALGNRKGELQQLLYLDHQNPGNNKLFRDSPAESVETVTVMCFDEVMLGLDTAIDFIKIDVQGAEVRVLEGMQESIRKQKKLIALVEFYPFGLLGMGNHPEDLLTLLWDYGFRIYDIKAQLAEVKMAAELIGRYPGRKFTNLWCVK